jgi:hypothetical protein
MGSELGPERGFAERAGQMERSSSNSSVIENGTSVQSTFLYCLTVKSISPSCRASLLLCRTLCVGDATLSGSVISCVSAIDAVSNYWVSSCNNFG